MQSQKNVRFCLCDNGATIDVQFLSLSIIAASVEYIESTIRKLYNIFLA